MISGKVLGRSSNRAIAIVLTFTDNVLSRQSNRIWLLQKNYITSLFMFLAWAYACSILFWKSTRHDDRKQTHNRKSEAPITRVNVCVYLRGMLHKSKSKSKKRVSQIIFNQTTPHKKPPKCEKNTYNREECVAPIPGRPCLTGL